jgi:hypothetical protein
MNNKIQCEVFKALFGKKPPKSPHFEKEKSEIAKLDNTFLEIAKTNQDPKEYKVTFLF